MKKSNWFAISLVVLAVFNLIAFTAPFNKTSTFWIGYIFGTIAVLLHLLVSQKTLNAGKELKSRFYGWPLMIVASIYMTVQIILSLLFMLASSIDAWISLIISALCLAICMIGMISGEGAKEIITSGRDGYLIRHRNNKMMVNKINDLINDQEKRKELGSAGRRKIKNYRHFAAFRTKEEAMKAKMILNERLKNMFKYCGK